MPSGATLNRCANEAVPEAAERCRSVQPAAGCVSHASAVVPVTGCAFANLSDTTLQPEQFDGRVAQSVLLELASDGHREGIDDLRLAGDLMGRSGRGEALMFDGPRGPADGGEVGRLVREQLRVWRVAARLCRRMRQIMDSVAGKV
jgi:hypothetical protein